MFFAAMPESGKPKCRLLRYRIQRRRKEPAAPARPAADLAEAARKMILASLELAEKVDAA